MGAVGGGGGGNVFGIGGSGGGLLGTLEKYDPLLNNTAHGQLPFGIGGNLLGSVGGGGFGINGTEIDAPVTMQQAQDAYKANQDALKRQQDFVTALAAQNGIANQSSVYNQLQGVANGTGPNPAQAMLNQATGANVANQAALMASQRGAGQNVGMIGRQAARQGADIQQQAAGQGATMQANQSLAALGQLGGMAGQQVAQQQSATQGLTQAQQQEQQQLLSNMAAANATRAGLQANINSSNAALMGVQMQGQQNMLGNIMGGIGSVFQMSEGGEVPRQHYADGVNPIPQNGEYADPINDPNNPFNQPPAAARIPQIPSPQDQIRQDQFRSQEQAKVNGPKSRVGKHFHFGQQNNQPGQQQQNQPLTGMSRAGDVMGKMIGRGIQKLFSPSDVKSEQGTDQAGTWRNDRSPDVRYAGANIDLMNAAQQAGQKWAPGYDTQMPASTNPEDEAAAMQPAPVEMPADNMTGEPQAAKGGKVPAMVSPGEMYLDRKAVQEVKKGAHPLNVGEKIPGKPKHPGNNYANDVVPKTLESGGVVIPNSIMEKPKNVRDKKSEEFVRQYLASGGRVKGMVIFHSKKAKK